MGDCRARFAGVHLRHTFVLCVACVLVFGGCSEKGRTSQQAASTPAPALQPKFEERSLRDLASDTGLAAEGRRHFQVYCAQCHGLEGKGNGPTSVRLNPPPRNFTSERFRYGSDIVSIYQTLMNGSPGTGMRSFHQLPPTALFALAHYVCSLVPNPAATTPEILARLPE
jgi:mono/diheme cytochrome c family protein